MKTVLSHSLQARPAMTQSLGQALAILELPQEELAAYLLGEIEKNPLLELDATPCRPFADFTNIEAKETLYEHLTAQIREKFLDDPLRSIAFSLLEQLDEKGYLPSSTPDSSVLSALQTLHPKGIFARNLKECLLLQMEPGMDAYRVLDMAFKDLLEGRFQAVQKKTGIEDLSAVIETLSRLAFRPKDLFQKEPSPAIVADLSISKIGKTWIVSTNDEALPQVRLQDGYLSLPIQSAEEKKLVRGWAASGKWLLRSLKRRKSILLEIGAILIRKQAAYLDQKGPLVPFSIQELSACVELHESTLSRALANKFASTPRGYLPLRSLLSSSSEAAKEKLMKLIAQEDKSKPMTDEMIAEMLSKEGSPLARRTVAKYRGELKILPASLRKLRQRS